MRIYKRKRRINDIYSVASDVVYLVDNTFDDIFVKKTGFLLVLILM